MFHKFKALSITKKTIGGLLVFSLLMLIIGAFSSSPAQKQTKLQLTQDSNNSSGQVMGDATTDSDASAASNSITTQTVTETQAIPYQSTAENDPNLAKGQTETITAGVDGSETLTYRITYTDGEQTDKQLVGTTVTAQPTNQITANGTYIAPVPKPVPTPKPAPKTGCYPLTNGGNCYEPGEYCRDSDHGAAGVAGDGKSIVCADNNGWRWEPR